jgi:hypothetical protein
MSMNMNMSMNMSMNMNMKMSMNMSMNMNMKMSMNMNMNHEHYHKHQYEPEHNRISRRISPFKNYCCMSIVKIIRYIHLPAIGMLLKYEGITVITANWQADRNF